MPKVLYAEDDESQRVMMRLILTRHNITLIEAVDGADALAKVSIHQPDLVILDLFMPRIDGFGVLNRLKSDSATQHIPIVVLSAWATGDNKSRVKKAGASAFVAKPYEPDEMIMLVKDQLSVLKTSAVKHTIRPQTRPLKL